MMENYEKKQKKWQADFEREVTMEQLRQTTYEEDLQLQHLHYMAVIADLLEQIADYFET